MPTIGILPILPELPSSSHHEKPRWESHFKNWRRQRFRQNAKLSVLSTAIQGETEDINIAASHSVAKKIYDSLKVVKCCRLTMFKQKAFRVIEHAFESTLTKVMMVISTATENENPLDKSNSTKFNEKLRGWFITFGTHAWEASRTKPCQRSTSNLWGLDS